MYVHVRTRTIFIVPFCHRPKNSEHGTIVFKRRLLTITVEYCCKIYYPIWKYLSDDGRHSRRKKSLSTGRFFPSSESLHDVTLRNIDMSVARLDVYTRTWDLDANNNIDKKNATLEENAKGEYIGTRYEDVLNATREKRTLTDGFRRRRRKTRRTWRRDDGSHSLIIVREISIHDQEVRLRTKCIGRVAARWSHTKSVYKDDGRNRILSRTELPRLGWRWKKTWITRNPLRPRLGI